MTAALTPRLQEPGRLGGGLSVEAAVSVSGLTKEYGGKLAVAGIDLVVPRGSVFSLVGPNGAGKTTTIEMIESIRRPTSGTIRVLGRDLKTNAASIRERIGVLPQELRLFDKLTPRESLEYFAALYRRALDVDEVLAFVGLREHADVWTAKLSGGLRRRLAIGTAIVNDPDVVFLDEPTAGLDPLARRALWDLIHRFKREGKTVFLTTHYMDEAQALSDTVAIIDQGRIIAMGGPSHLIRLHGGERSVLIRGVPPDRLVEARRLSATARFNGAGDLVLTLGSDANIGSFLQDLKDAGIPTSEVVLKDPSLDDVFVSLTTQGKTREVWA